MRSPRRDVAALVLVVLGCAEQAEAARPLRCRNDGNLHVEETGSDTTGTGTACRPWKTLEKARTVMRTRGVNGTRALTIVIAGDLWETAVVYQPLDSGASGKVIKIKARDGVGTARIAGGKRATGWSPVDANIYRATVDSQTFHALYENHYLALAARTPNLGSPAGFPLSSTAFPSARDVYKFTDGIEGSYTVMRYRVGDMDPTTWLNLSDVQVFIWSGSKRAWFTDQHGISAVDTGARTFTLQDGGTKLPTYEAAIGTVGSRYFVQGDRSFLDQAGEWYLDRTAGCVSESGKACLYYWPRGLPIASQEIVYPTTQEVLSFAGTDSTTRTKYIEIDPSVEIEYSDHPAWYRQGYATDDGSGEHHFYSAYDYFYNPPTVRHGMVRLENTDHITIGGHLVNAGLNCVYARGYNQQDTVAHGGIERCGASGIFLEGNYPGEGDVLREWTMTDEIIRDTGQLVGNGQGITLANTGHHTLSYMEIYNSPRDAIHQYGWGCGAGFDAHPCDQTAVYATGNDYNHLLLHSGMQGSGDAALLRTSFLMNLGVLPQTLVSTYRHIIIDGAVPTSSVTDFGPNGLFCDNESFSQDFGYMAIYQTRGSAQRNNGSGNHTLTNVSWSGTYDHTLVDAASAGALSTNPWASRMTYTLTDGFEAGLGGWTTARAAPSTSGACARTGSLGMSTTGQGSVFAVYNHRMHQVATAWFKDDASVVTNTFMIFRADEFASNTNNAVLAGNLYGGAGWRGIGVDAPFLANTYEISEGALAFDSGYTRTTGWHEFKIDDRSKDHADYYIDGVKVRSSPGGSADTIMFNKIAIGSVAGPSTAGAFCWDDVSIN